MIHAKNWVKAQTTNSTDAAFTSKIATVTEPSGAGVLAFAAGAEMLEVSPFGAGADNATTAIRVIGWRKVGTLWVPTILTELDMLLSAAVGVAGEKVINTDRFVDTITQLATPIGIAVLPAAVADTPAKFLLDISGQEKIELIYKRTTATNTNALVAVY